jgi:tetratricopeptide (TPR) repeat protein
VTAQLIETRSGTHVWSESYDRDFRDVLVLQDEVANSIARELRLVVNSPDQTATESMRNPEAYTLYLRGRLAFDRGDVSALRESQADFEQALVLDPTLTRAAEGLLLADLNLVYEGLVPPTTGYSRLRELAEDTLRRTPGSVFAHTTLAWVHAYYDYNLAACNHELDAVLATGVHDPVTLAYTAWIASVVRRMDVAERLIHQAIVIDPLSPDAYQALGAVLRDAGDLAGAERGFRQSLSISPTFAGSHLYLAQVLYYRKQFPDALAEATAEAPSLSRQAFLVGIHFVLGRKHESDALLADLTRNVDNIDAYWIATAYTMRGEKDKAFEWLDKGYARHELSLHTQGDPVFAPLRGDPRWATLLKRLSE